jgi:hypothetical protein
MEKGNGRNAPDHTLVNSHVPSAGEPPRVYAVTDLQAFVKPTLDEELGGPGKENAVTHGRTICLCVPVMTCVCNTVTYYFGSEAGAGYVPPPPPPPPPRACPPDCACNTIPVPNGCGCQCVPIVY